MGVARNFAAFHWARKLVFTSFPVGNIVPLKSEVVFPSGKLGNSASTPTAEWEIQVGKYEFPSPMERSICLGGGTPEAQRAKNSRLKAES